jgi:sigma-B regulation protein RsbU (phosphoserine phosphatase)
VNAELMCILKPMDSPLYATAFYLVVDTARRTIRFAKAGHPNPLLLKRSTGEVKTLNCPRGTQGPALGLIANAKYCTCETPLEPDDLIFMFTDGICEVFDRADNEFGVDKLAAALKQRRELPLDALLDGVLAEARAFSATNSFDDDVCLIAIESVATKKDHPPSPVPLLRATPDANVATGKRAKFGQ